MSKKEGEESTSPKSALASSSDSAGSVTEKTPKSACVDACR